VTGETLFAREPETPVAPASVTKVVTAAAALATLGPDAVFSTTVRATDDPQKIVLVGGGDATLSARPSGSASVYVGAPTLQDLAEKTVAALSQNLAEGDKVAITEVVVDASLWNPEDSWDASWASDARFRGNISQVTALQVDGDRDSPSVDMSRRGNNAINRAADAFVQELRKAGNTARFVTLSFAVAPADSTVLASVSSRPVVELVAYMLKESDNTLAEMLARHVSLSVGLGGSSASVNPAIGGALAAYGLPVEDLSLRDGSGLSALNQVTPAFVTSLLVEIARSSGDLALVRQGLPIAGVDGSLDDRFTGVNVAARESVAAKTGSITGVRSLAGFVTAQDGTELAFAFFSTGTVGDETRQALETVVTGVHTCGSNLADF